MVTQVYHGGCSPAKAALLAELRVRARFGSTGALAPVQMAVAAHEGTDHGDDEHEAEQRQQSEYHGVAP